MKWPFSFNTKTSRAGQAISQFVRGQTIYTPRDYYHLSKQGYEKNIIAFRCINVIAQAAASVSWLVYDKNDEVTDSSKNPLAKLIAKPNPTQGFDDLVYKFTAFLLCHGNSYVEGTALPKENQVAPPLELYNLRPDRVKIIGGDNGLPEKYRYTANGIDVDYDFDQFKGRARVFHQKTFHPTNDWYGLAPLEAGAFSIDQHNAAGEHNASLLQNRAVPSSLMIYDQLPTEGELKKVKQILTERFSGPRNAGKPMILSGNVEWKDISISPRELDFNEGTLRVARDICQVFGVPHVLVVPGESTFRNMEEARLFLWEETVIPILKIIRGSLFGWLLSYYPPGMRVDFNLDDVSALIPRRLMHREMIVGDWTSDLITKNEARMALQYDKVPDGDHFYSEHLQSDPAGDTSGDVSGETDTSKGGKKEIAPLA